MYNLLILFDDDSYDSTTYSTLPEAFIALYLWEYNIDDIKQYVIYNTNTDEIVAHGIL